jgi:hypothetical protein
MQGRPVYDSVLHHDCNGYCRDGIHAHLAWVETGDFDTTPADALNEQFGFMGLEVVDAKPAPEAPPYTDQRAEPVVQALPGLWLKLDVAPPENEAWLVWFKGERFLPTAEYGKDVDWEGLNGATNHR